MGLLFMLCKVFLNWPCITDMMSFTARPVMTSRLEQRAELEMINYEDMGQIENVKMCKNIYLGEDLD